MSADLLDAHEAHTLAQLTGRIDWDRLTDEYLDGQDEAPAGWRRLATWTQHQADEIRRDLTVIEVTNDEPYRSEQEQFKAIRLGFFSVSNQHCEHPYWTPAQNVNFRIWHDVDGHHELRAPFDRLGEVLVFYRHAEQLRFELSLGSPADRLTAIDALFSESIYQLAHSISAGYFARQRCVRVGRYGRVVRDAIRTVFPELLEIGGQR